MPKRTNNFQKLIYLIHQKIGNEAVVTESKILIDKVTQEKREIDIVIEFDKSGYQMIISIECIDHKRKADVTWVEKMISKHANLTTNKLILVSNSGFTNNALRKCEFYNIESLSFESATKIDWEARLNNLTALKYCEVAITPTNVIFYTVKNNARKKEMPQPTTNILDKTGQIKYTAYTFVHSALNDPKITEELLNRIEPLHKGFRIEFDYSGYYLDYALPKQREIVRVTVEGKISQGNDQIFELNKYKYKDIFVASGEIKTALGPGLVCAVEEKEREPAFSILLNPNLIL